MNKIFKKILGVFIFVVSLFIISNVSAAKMSDEFKSYLNKDGKLVINSVPLESGIEFVFEYEFSMDENGEYLDNGIMYSVSDDKKTVDFTINSGKSNEETHKVEILYNYDPKVQKTFEDYFKKFPKDKQYFKVTDLELINYWINNIGNEDSNPLDHYSGELKSYLNYSNIQLIVDNRAGGGSYFTLDRLGVATFRYKGIIYYLDEGLGTRAEYAIYVPDNTGNSADELINAAQKRIDDYIGKGKVQIEFGGNSIYNFLLEPYDVDIQLAEQELAYEMAKPDNERDQLKIMNLEDALEWAKYYKESFVEEWNDPKGGYTFLKEAGDNYFNACVLGNEPGSTVCYPMVIIKDSSKMLNPRVKTADTSTKVEISTKELLPLDLTIQAKQLESGSEYEKIVKLLKLNDNLTFDLNLYSESLKDYITKLDDGSFEVKIPIPNSFKNKNLKVYYVDDNGKTEEYKVTIEDGYAVFKTNHFSIYTLAADGEEKVPNTFDGIGSIFIIGLISLMGLISTIIYYKKKIRVN